MAIVLILMLQIITITLEFPFLHTMPNILLLGTNFVHRGREALQYITLTTRGSNLGDHIIGYITCYFKA